MSALYSIQHLSILRKHHHWSVQFSSSFYLSPSIGKLRNDSGILRQGYGVIRSFIRHHQSTDLVRLWYPSSKLRSHTRFADESILLRGCRLGHHLGRTSKLAIRITTSDQSVRSVHSCNTGYRLSSGH